MIVIAGLGNPGKKYENTRHNMGFLTIDRIAEKNDIKVNKIKHRALVGDGFISGHKVLLVKPQTYMNLSGESLREVMNYYNVDIEDLIVIYDDFDIETGSLRIRKKGSAGSHNGMKSVIYQLKNDGFPRVRVGIGKSGSLDWKDFVLGKVGGAESDAISQAISNAADAVECMISEGIDIAMNKYNKKKKKTAENEECQEVVRDGDRSKDSEKTEYI